MSLAHDLEAPDSDEAIVAAVRRGRVGEFAVLYERYKDEALRIARRDAGPDDGPDLVQEAFARVLRAIRNGGGPTEDVAGYLFRTLRNLRIDRGTRREVPSDDIEALSPPGLWVVEDDADGALDRGLVSDAFKELPPRWREVLWLTEVEGAGPGELSDRMGMRPTAVSTLSARARHGFRSAWLQAHVRSGDVPAECRPVVARLGDYQTGRLSPRRRAEVERHLDGCAACPALIAELTAVSERLGVLLLPIVILAPKAIWWVFGSGLAKAGVLLVGGIGQARHAIHDPKVALSAGGGTVAAGVIVAAAFMWLSPGGESPADATPSEPSTSAPAATAPSSPAVPPSSTAPDDQPTPTPEPTPDPDPTPTPEPTPDPDPAPAPDQRRAPAPGPAPDPTRDPTPQPSPEPTPTPEPSLPTPDPPTIATPAGTVLVAPPLTGTAEPGATVTVRGDGAAVGVATADEQGSWAVVPDAPAETFTATQEVSESGEFAGSSPASEPAGPFEYDEPVWSAALRDSSRILEDLDGDGVQAELPIEFRGERDAQARVLIDGEDVGGTMIATPGQTQRYVPNLDPGSYELGIHYADPETDAVGPTVTTTVTAVEPD